MYRVLYFLAFATLLVFGCKKENILTNQAPASSAMELAPSSYQMCYGNSWDYDHIFYPDWYHQPVGLVSDAQPLVYNNKVYVPDYDDQQVHIFDGNGWQHLSSAIALPTNYQNVSFTIGTKGYVGRSVGTTSKEFYQYSFGSNTWTRKTDCPFSPRNGAATFTIGIKGYVSCGVQGGTSTVFKDLWEYNSINNTWTKKADLPVGLYGTSFFALGGKGYIVNGRRNSSTLSSNLYEYDPSSNTWSNKAAFPGVKRQYSIAFVIAGQAYCGGGKDIDGNPLTDYYKYDPVANSWTSVASMSLYFMQKPVYGFSINSLGYGVYRHTVGDDLYSVKYTPLTCANP